MALKILPALILAVGCLFSNRLCAESTNVTATLEAQLRDWTIQVQTKAQAGQTAETDYTNELATLDTLIATNQVSQPDAAAQVTYLKAVLYLQVIQDFKKCGVILSQITNRYPNTEYSTSATKLLGKLDQFAEQKKQAEAAKKLQSSLVAGMVFPDFSVTNLAGQPLSVGALKGKVVLVDFWATWCGPCRAELPNVIATYQKYHAQGFEVIGVSLDSDREKLDAFLKQQEGMTWPQYFDGQGWGNQLAQKYGVQSIPFALLIGPDGKILGKELRGDELQDAVAKAVAAK